MSNYKLNLIQQQIKIILVCCFLFTPTLCKAQNNNELEITLSSADSLYRLREFSIADSLFQIVKLKSEENRQWTTWINAIRGKRRIANQLREFQSFIDSLQNYIHLPPDSEININGKLNYYIASFSSKVGKPAEAIEYFSKALPLLEESNDTVFYLSTINNLSNQFSRSQDQYSANKISKQGIEFLKNNKGNNYYRKFLSNKGIYQVYNNQYNEADKTFHSTKLYYENDDYPNLNLAFNKIRRNDIDSAEYYFNKIAKPINRNLKRDFHKYQSELFVLKNDFDKAINEQKEVVKIVSQENNHRTYTREKLILAELFYSNNDYDNAILTAHQAIHALYPKLDTTNIFDLPTTQEKPDLYIIRALFVKAQCHTYLYQTTNNSKHKQAILPIYELMFNLFEDLKDRIHVNRSIYQIGAFSKAIYSEAVSAFLLEYEETGNDEYYNRALKLAQLSNSFVLRNTVSDRKALTLSQIPDNEVNSYLNLKNKITQAYDNSSSNILDSLIIPFNKKRKELMENYPAYASLSKENIISLDDIKSGLAKNELLLKYFYHNNKVTVFNLTKEDHSYHHITLNDEDLNSIKRFKEIISSSSAENTEEEEFIKAAKDIYDKLLSHLQENENIENITQLLIVPDGPLKNISFNALMHQKTNSWIDLKAFLLNRYQISYLYYISQLQEKETSNKPSLDFVGFGINYQDEYLDRVKEEYFQNTRDARSRGTIIENLRVINHAIQEVTECASLFGGSIFTEEKATKSTILHNLNKAAIAHFAMHSIADENEFLNSYLLLKSDQDEKRSKLTYKEILELNLESDLVVLSACQTSTGSDQEGEGMMSMARAFSQSGSQAVMGTYWNAPDFTTKEIMKMFYEGLKKGLNKSEALRQAQINYLSDDALSSPALRSPFYWAGWSLYGNTASVTGINFPWTYILSFITVLAIILLIIRLIKSKSIKV